MLKTYLINKFKHLIDLHVEIAVEKAEKAFGNGKGELKKQMAVDYIMQFIKLPSYLQFLKPFISGTLKVIIGEAIELTLAKLKAISDNK